MVIISENVYNTTISIILVPYDTPLDAFLDELRTLILYTGAHVQQELADTSQTDQRQGDKKCQFLVVWPFLMVAAEERIMIEKISAVDPRGSLSRATLPVGG